MRETDDPDDAYETAALAILEHLRSMTFPDPHPDGPLSRMMASKLIAEALRDRLRDGMTMRDVAAALAAIRKALLLLGAVD